MQIELILQRSGIYGGIKRLYRLAAYFIEAGHTAVVNIDDGTTNTWFGHSVPENVSIDPDIRIIPETWQRPHPTAKNILYVQAQFDPPQIGYDYIVTTTDFLSEYISKEGCSSDLIVPYGIDSNKFKPCPNKRIQGRIGFMPRKNKQELELIQKLCTYQGIEYYPIDGLNEQDTITALQTCDLFIAASREEGFGLPPFEASLCGCLIVGYHGKGGKKWLTPTTYAPCQFPQEFTLQIGQAISGHYEKQRKSLRSLILSDLTIEKERDAWLNILNEVI